MIWIFFLYLFQCCSMLNSVQCFQGVKARTLGRQNERNNSYVRLAHTSIFGLCFMSVCLKKSHCYSLIYSSLINCPCAVYWNATTFSSILYISNSYPVVISASYTLHIKMRVIWLPFLQYKLQNIICFLVQVWRYFTFYSPEKYSVDVKIEANWK